MPQRCLFFQNNTQRQLEFPRFALVPFPTVEKTQVPWTCATKQRDCIAKLRGERPVGYRRCWARKKKIQTQPNQRNNRKSKSEKRENKRKNIMASNIIYGLRSYQSTRGNNSRPERYETSEENMEKSCWDNITHSNETNNENYRSRRGKTGSKPQVAGGRREPFPECDNINRSVKR